MRIAIAGLVTQPITENPAGGTEAFTYLLVEGLVKRGHDITLYCAKGSKTSAQKQVEICEPSAANDEESNLHFVYPYTLLEVRALLEDIKKNKFDIVHINFLKTFLMSYFAKQVSIPLIYTMHRDFFSRPAIYEVYKQIGFSENEHFIYVSKKAYELSLVKQNGRCIYNGINILKFPYSQEGKFDNYLWLSRVDELKGCLQAAQAASKAGVKLILSGVIGRTKYQEYFDSYIKPLLNTNIQFEEGQSSERKVYLYKSAKAFLFPIQWEEPFGLVLAESMACGTPIIAFARGAIPEIVKDGVTGFIVNSSDTDVRGNWIVKKTGIEGLVEAIKLINNMPPDEYKKMRQVTRSRAEDNFTIEKTVESYESLYKSLISKE